MVRPVSAVMGHISCPENHFPARLDRMMLLHIPDSEDENDPSEHGTIETMEGATCVDGSLSITNAPVSEALRVAPE